MLPHLKFSLHQIPGLQTPPSGLPIPFINLHLTQPKPVLHPPPGDPTTADASASLLERLLLPFELLGQHQRERYRVLVIISVAVEWLKPVGW